MSAEISPENTYVPLARVNEMMAQAQTSTLANIEIGVGVILTLAKYRSEGAAAATDEHERRALEASAADLSTAATTLRAIIDALLASPLQAVAAETSPMPGVTEP